MKIQAIRCAKIPLAPRTQRRLNERKQRLFRHINSCLLGLLCVALSFAGYWSWQQLTNPQVLPFHHVTIDGNIRYTPQNTLLQTVRLHLRGGFFALDTAALKQNLLNLPWIADVTLRRIWPDTLKIVVTEHKPFANWNDNGIISSENQLFFPPDNPTLHTLPRLYGPAGSINEVVTLFQQLNQTLIPLRIQVIALQFNERHNWQIILSNGLKVSMDQKKLMERWQRFVAVYPKIIGDKVDLVDSVDLRYSSGLAMQWKNTSALALSGTNHYK